ncbi:4-hydroxy-tetrahydrodipicolinate synthase [Hyphobacterium sp. CCMP332]|uniref:4-hydroxy-tetrahydrodipicolinate synthase n=1 Tax=Hyphobacterium sp. CCMP332 TaxID=2749086 RepID=UPI00164EF8DC|nr:4-hydroxy-tetrahydrodipicolinate synthase [Hyphobacterium sp. CCMP332]QNL18823.1 4-hydroxy-tetrahydrodipicolinate synthase [Hyphobacterium sp. CCMP332]
MLSGSITALVTPFKNNAVDEAAFQALVERQIDSGTHGLVPVGTTGESPTLSLDEKKRVIALTIEVANGRVPVIAGTGSNNTAASVEMTQWAKEAGADAALVVAPFYNKPSQEGLFRHFEAISASCDLPVVVYNIPGRSIVDIQPETMARIATLPAVIGVKDATGDLTRVGAHRRLIGDKFIQLSGEDPTAIGYNAEGGVGCISVSSNVAPALCAQLQNATLSGDYQEALEVGDMLQPLHKALFLSPSPGPAKYALSLLGLCLPDVRLPLTEPDDAAKAAVQAAMEHAGLI